MMDGMKRVLVLLTAVLAAFAGAWAAFGYSQHFEAQLKEVAEANDFAIQMEKYKVNARLPGKTRAEQALWLQLGEQLSFRRRNNSTFPADMLSIEAAYTYARLSELAKDRKDEAASLELLEDAVAICRQSMSVNCLANDLLKIVRVMDGKETP
jgi:hypothetical protein